MVWGSSVLIMAVPRVESYTLGLGGGVHLSCKLIPPCSSCSFGTGIPIQGHTISFILLFAAVSLWGHE